MSVCLSRSFKLLLLFCFSMESSHFWPSVFHIPLYNMLLFDFWFRSPNVQNLLPKICTNSPISRLVWQIDRRCLHLPGGFRWWPIQWNHAKCCGADTCCYGNDIWARRGNLVAHWFVHSVCLSEDVSKIYERIFMKFSGGMGRGRRKDRLYFGSDLDSFVDPGSFSRILQHYEIGHTAIGAATCRVCMN